MASKVSRKRNQGKARKAKAKAREEAEESRKNNIQTPDGQQQQSLEAQMQRLQIGVGKAQRDTTKCLHGFEKMDDICGKFVIAFREAYYDAVKDGGKTASDCLVRAEAATLDGFAEVWNDSAKMELAISFFLHLERNKFYRVIIRELVPMLFMPGTWNNTSLLSYIKHTSNN